MVNLVLKFVASSRASGLSISTSEVLDCMNQLKLIDPVNETRFRTVLRANFAKSRREQGQFDRLYDFFFHGTGSEETVQQQAALKRPLDAVLDELKKEEPTDSTEEMILKFLAGDPLDLLSEIQRIQTEETEGNPVLKSNLGSISSRLHIMLAINRTRQRLVTFLGDNHSPADTEDYRQLERFITSRLETAQVLLRENPRPYHDDLKQIDSQAVGQSRLGERSFASLSQDEIAEMREVIGHLVRKLKDIVSRRLRANRHGKLDVKKTLRTASRYQGVPIRIEYQDRSPRKGRIVTLCDLSSSVWATARFMLNMLYSMQECFSQVRSFAFVSGLCEISEIFKKNEVNDAIEQVMSEPGIDLNALTDYGETFRQFKRNNMQVLNKKTTLIIVGDGRSNYMNPQEHILEEMRDKCRRLIWLNPESERFWATGDCEMLTYKAYCHEIRQCRNLNQLMDFIEGLVL